MTRPDTTDPRRAPVKLHHSETVTTPRDQVWEAFMDLTRVGSCFPGAAVTEVDGDDFVGNIRAKIGFLGVTFNGTGTMTAADRSGEVWHARIESTGSESHGLGKADIVIDLHLSELPGDGPRDATLTQMALDTELTVHGLPTRLGNGLAQRISGPLVGKFLRCMAS